MGVSAGVHRELVAGECWICTPDGSLRWEMPSQGQGNSQGQELCAHLPCRRRKGICEPQLLLNDGWNTWNTPGQVCSPWGREQPLRCFDLGWQRSVLGWRWTASRFWVLWHMWEPMKFDRWASLPKSLQDTSAHCASKAKPSFGSQSPSEAAGMPHCNAVDAVWEPATSRASTGASSSA